MAAGDIKIKVKVVREKEFFRIINGYARACKQLEKLIVSFQKAQIEYKKFLKIMDSLKQ